MVFLLCVVVSGIMEYVTGWVLYNVFHTRLWDYNTEIWNFGNIGGYICLRSVLFFGVSGLLLIYAVIPILIKVTEAADPAVLTVVCRALAAAFIIDITVYRIMKSREDEARQSRP